MVAEPFRLEGADDLFVFVGPAIVGVRQFKTPRQAERLMRMPQCAAQRSAGVGGTRRYPDTTDIRAFQYFRVGNTVERHPAAHAEVTYRILFQETAHAIEDDLLGHGLQGEGKIAVLVGERFVRPARSAKGVDEFPAEGTQLTELVVVEIAHIDGVAAVR